MLRQNQVWVLHNKTNKNFHINICPKILRFRCTAPTFAGIYSLKFVGTPKTPMYSGPSKMKKKTFHQRNFDAFQAIRNRPGTFQECASSYVSMHALIEVEDILSNYCEL